MPVYNGQRFLDEAISSVLAQDFGDFEFVIVDDGSTDGTYAMLERWAAQEPRIVVVRSERNEGISTALNKGIAAARAEYIARQDADDICARGRLVRQVEVLDSHPDVAIVCAGYHLIDTRGRRTGTMMRRQPSSVMEYLLHFSNSIGGHGQVMFRRADALAVGGYRREFDLSEDYDLWTRLIRRGRIVALPIIGMHHRHHGGKVSVVWRERQLDRSLSISRRMLTALLGRPLSDDEFSAITGVWRQQVRPGATPLAHRTFVVIFERFFDGNPSHEERRRARMATAHRWVLTAAVAARHGSLVESAQHLYYALLWHPLGFARGTADVARAAATRVWRVAFRWR